MLGHPGTTQLTHLAVQQVCAGEQFQRLSVPNCDPVSLTLAAFIFFLNVLFIGPSLAESLLTNVHSSELVVLPCGVWLLLDGQCLYQTSSRSS